MKFFRPVLSLLLSVAAFARPASNKPKPSRIWITDVTIVSPENPADLTRGSVLIENEHIARVERKARAKPPADATVISGKGGFLIPGLIDSHVHVTVIPGVGFGEGDSKSEMVKAYLKQVPRSYLYYGYTTLVDLGVGIDHPAMDDFRESPLHPDLYSCGDALPLVSGYPMVFFPAATRFKLFPNFIYDPQQASSIPPEYKPQDHTPAADVARVKAAGGICVKTFFERGFSPKMHFPVISPDTFAETRKAATKAGLVLLIHANSFEAQKFGVNGNTDVLAHGMWHWGAFDKEPELPIEIKQLLDQIVEKKIGYQATMRVLPGELAYFDPDYLRMPAIPKVIPKDMLDWFNSPEGKWFKKEIDDEGTPDAEMQTGYERGPIRRLRQVIGYLAARNANFLFGTDTPSAPTYGNLPGLNGYLEVQQLHEAGLSLEQILRAATINNAREFKLDSQVGSIEPGKIANIVLLRKSPLESVDAYESIVTVWVHGRPISRESLAASPSK